MESEALRQQFQALQEQQQKKLLKAKQRQEEKSKKKESTSNDNGQPEDALGISDDLGLMLCEPIPNDVLYDEELNRHLTEQIRELKDESGRLYKLLSERDYEIRKMKKQRDEDRHAIAGTGVASDSAATKIVELSKKNREMTAELESERTKVKQLLRRVRDAEKEMQVMAQGGSGNNNNKMIIHRTADEEEKDKMMETTAAELKSTQDKLSHTTNKLSEYRNQANTLKQELKVAHKVLSNEVGDNVNVQSLLNSTSGWRGRAQQILLLQNKVSELKSQVEHQRGRPGTQMSLEDQFMNMDVTADSDTLSMTGMMTTRSVKSGSMEERQKQRIRKLEKERRDAKEKANEDFKTLEEEHSKLKEKCDAVKARNKVLSNEMKSLKQQMTTLKDKGKHDDELIEALMKQQSHLKDLLDQTSESNKKVKAKEQEAALMLQQKNQQEANLVEQLKRIVSEKEQKVHQLEQEIEDIKNRHHQKSQHSNGIFHRPPSGSIERPLTVVSITDRPGSGEMHSYNSPTPPPPSSRQGGRPNSRQGMRTISRHSNNGSPMSNGRPSSRPSSTGSVTDRGILVQLEDVRRQCHEYKATSQAAEVERDKLMELVQILQQRVDEASSKITDSQAQVQQIKQHNVMLEKQLGRIQMAEGKSSGKGGRKQNTGQPHYSNKSDEMLLKEDLPPTRGNVEELQTRLILQMDENHALKSALESSMQAKKEDLKLYHEMMNQTRHVFLQGLRQYKQTNQNS
ncbi:coiled-coil domain-containing protein 13-like [Amphiura filiformis]|uniref:coiled-coil domain-containing protein 13-like n=1 Tax=Amphiura filiformis TaxID=82378 RepID=UPI003B227F78